LKGFMSEPTPEMTTYAQSVTKELQDEIATLKRHWSEDDRDLNEMTTCPCKLADTPCHPKCTCVNGISSHGCACCATYGSEEQRKAKAQWLVNHLEQLSKLETVCEGLARFVSQYTDNQEQKDALAAHASYLNEYKKGKWR